MNTIFNNLKHKAKCIVNNYGTEMNQIDRELYNRLIHNDYITLNDVELYNNCDYRYRAFNSGLV